MTSAFSLRAWFAVAFAAAVIVSLLLTGAPTAVAMIAFAAGAAACAVVTFGLREPIRADPIRGRDGEMLKPGLDELFHAIDEPMLLVRDRRVVTANESALTLLGRHIEGTDVRLALRHPAAAERLTGEPTQEDELISRTELVGLGGADRHWVMTTARLGDGSLLVRLTDLSQARAAEQMRSDFVANASHELRTPLATLLGFLETLLDEQTVADSETRTRFLRIMYDEATRMRTLVDDLMSLSRIEAERFAAPDDPVDLVPILESVRASLATLSETRNAEIVIENEAEVTVVPGDPAQLCVLFNNLITNALNYGRPDTSVRIRLADTQGSLLRIEVIDRGDGIPPEHIPRLTERFYRVDTSRSRAMGGTGLGLAIAKHIALRHRGRLEIVSREGEGTSARVFLPLFSDPHFVMEQSQA